MTATQLLPKQTIAQDRAITKRKLNKVKINVFLDLLLTGVFIVEQEEHFLGLQLHELLGLVFGAALILHIVLHWDWVVNITKTFFKKLLHESRLNYVLNVALFLDMAFVTISGILISRTLGLSLGLAEDFTRTLQTLHMVGSELVLILVALHIAMHWKWIKTNGSKYLFGWIPRLTARAK